MKKLCCLLALLLLIISAKSGYAASNKWQIDQEKSSIRFSIIYEGETVTGFFKNWNADITFNPAALNETNITTAIQMGSITTEDPMYNNTLQQKEWFNTKLFPTAVFTSQSIQQIDDTHFSAQGTLEIKEIRLPITLPFTLSIKNNKATMSGQVVLNRTDYAIGTEAGDETKNLDNNVTVDIAVEATQLP